MAQRTGGIRRPLANATLYSLLQRGLGAENVRCTFVDEHLRPVQGERILDLGCGPGDILELLPPVDYVGVDNSRPYIDAGRERFGDRARFICTDVRGLELDDEPPFDAAISIGVLHHLDDDAVAGMARLAARALAPGGRLVTIDPGFAAGQHGFARWLIGRDRGQSVRTPDGYKAIVGRHFGSVEAAVRHDLARIPYTHVILECRDPAQVS